MQVEHLSTTLISGWALCPTRAWDAYAVRNEHGDDTMSTEPTRFGSVVHDVCERAHNLHMRGEEVPPALDLFDECWRARDCYDFDYFALGRDLLGGFLERTIRERQGSTIATELHFTVDMANPDRVWLHDGLTREQIRAVNQGVIATGGVPVMSKIDRVDRDGDVLYVYDYKTNLLPFTRDEVDNSLQLGIYAIAVRALYPWAREVVCVFDMVRHGRFPVQFSEEKLDTMRAYLVNLWSQIDAAPETPRRLNTYCNWCHLRGDCPVYLAALEEAVPQIVTAETEDGEGLLYLVEQYETLKARKKVIDSRVDELGAALSARVVQGGGPVRVGDREIYLSPNPKSEYPAAKIYELFNRRRALVLLRDVMSIPKGAMDRALKSIPFASEVEALLVRGYNRSSLKTRSVNPTIGEEEDA